MSKPFVCALAFCCALIAQSVANANLIVNGGFESGSAVAGNVPTTFATWQGDQSAYVAAENAITPPEGSRMLRFIYTNAGGPGPTTNTAQYFQNIDLSAFSAEIASGNARLSASTLFNRVTGTALTDTAFGFQLIAKSGTPSAPTTLASVSQVIFTDGLTNTWELASLSNFVLPPATTFVLFELDAFENIFNSGSDPEFDGHYADDVIVTLAVPEPSGLVFIAIALVALLLIVNGTERMRQS